MPARSAQIHFDHSGNWSGGGRAFLNNAEHASSRHTILSGDTDSTPLVPRNFPDSSRLRTGNFILAPQNVWPWNPIVETPSEAKIALGLRVPSEIALRRAAAVMRISTAVPLRGQKVPNSPIIPNVLDTGFEEAISTLDLEPRSSTNGSFVCIGSTFSYKNIERLVAAYKLYRDGGGSAGLFLAGAPSNPKVYSRVQSALEGLDKVTIVGRPIDRHQALHFMRRARAVVLPSLVEASPLTALEAAWANPNVIMSDIAGHREVFGHDARVPDDSYFPAGSVGPLAQRLWTATDAPLEAAHSSLNDYEYRENARVKWGDSIAEWIQSLDL